jgi:hypothetical protein
MLLSVQNVVRFSPEPSDTIDTFDEGAEPRDT